MDAGSSRDGGTSAKAGTSRPQVRCALLQAGQASGSTLWNAPKISVKHNADHEVGHCSRGGICAGSCPPHGTAWAPRATSKLIQHSLAWGEGSDGAGFKPDSLRDLVHRRSLGFTSPRKAQQDLHRDRCLANIML